MDLRTPIKLIPDYHVKSRVQILSEVQDYNHTLMNIPAMWNFTTGKGVKVVILDTGLPNHPDLMPMGGKSFIPHYLEDQNGHSTHCAGILAAIAKNDIGVQGIAPDVEDYYGAVLGGDGSGGIQSIIDGIHWAVDVVGADVISMSLGISAGQPLVRALENACNYAHTRGTTIVAAAGNEAWKVGQPAIYDSVIAVAAVNNRKQHADFSNTGPEVDFAAGGVNVYSTYLNRGYAKLSGTSMACPALAGVAALIIARHKEKGESMSPEHVREHLKRIAFDVGPDGFDETFGHGIPFFKTGQDIVEIPLDPYEPEPTPPAPQPPQGPEVKKSGPRANCVYWNMFDRFITAVNKEAGKHEDMPMSKCIRAGFKQLGSDASAVTRIITEKD